MLPILFSSDHFILYTYPLFVGISWGLAYRIIDYSLLRFSASVKTNLPRFVIGCFFSAWVGAKLLFLAVNYQHIALIKNSSFWLGGGFVFYGGAIGVLIFILIYSQMLKLFPTEDIPLLAPAAAISHAVGRIGCFFAGCCFGKECELFRNHKYLLFDRIPVQLLEAILLIVLAKILWMMLVKNMKKNVIVTYLGCYSIIRFAMELLRADESRGFYNGLSTSQWISILIMVALSIYLLCRFMLNRRRLQ